MSNDGIFDAVIAGAKAAEESGFDRILLMDHFHQPPGIGDIDSEILECYTTLDHVSHGCATLSGEHYDVTDAIHSPPPVSRIPLMIGGSGEKKTLRMVAQYADESNLTCAVDEIPRKLDALAAHCERLGPDRSEIAVTELMNVVIGNTHDEALAAVEAYVENHGWPAEVVELMVSQVVLGDPGEVGEAIGDAIAAGLDGITLNLVANAHDPEMVALAGRTAGAASG